MLGRELQAGDFVLGGVHLSVLAVEGDEVVLGILALESDQAAALEGEPGPALRARARTDPASQN